MNAEQTRWYRTFAPDVDVTTSSAGMMLRTPTGHIKLPPTEAVVVATTLLAAGADSGTVASDHGSGQTGNAAPPAGSDIVDRLDRAGLVAHRLVGTGGHIATCIPLRPPTAPRPRATGTAPMHLAAQAMVRARDGGMSLEMPGAWARIAVHDTKLYEVLPLLAAGCTARDVINALDDRPADWTHAVLCALHWCELITGADGTDWPLEDLALHAASRQGYARVQLGKSGQDRPAAPDLPTASLARIALKPVNADDLIHRDPPFATVACQRRSRRAQGDAPITANQLSEFLFRSLHQRDGRRPYPSGGACYPLTGYLALHQCQDVQSGLYRYDAAAHSLDMVAESGPALNRLLSEAAANAGVTEPPQVLLVLSAHFAKTRNTYRNLSYSLILKEVGAIFQMAQLSAAAMALAACPLGTGNARAFSALAGLDPLVETSVGEMLLGTASGAD